MVQHSTTYRVQKNMTHQHNVELPNVWHQKLATTLCLTMSLQNFRFQIGKLPNCKFSPLGTHSCRKFLILLQYGSNMNSKNKWKIIPQMRNQLLASKFFCLQSFYHFTCSTTDGGGGGGGGGSCHCCDLCQQQWQGQRLLPLFIIYCSYITSKWQQSPVFTNLFPFQGLVPTRVQLPRE